MRNIFIVNATVVDANGNYNTLTGYPKSFDSNNYGGDTDKAYRRAQGDFSEVWGGFCKRDDRMMQTVTLTQANGQLLDRKSVGAFPPDPEPEPEQA